MHYLKSYGINKKRLFLLFFNYLKTETRKNSEKNYTYVSLDGRCSSTFRKNFYFKFNNTKKNFKQIDFFLNVIFEKSEKIHINFFVLHELNPEAKIQPA